MDTAAEFIKHSKDLRETWQGRALATASGKTGMVLLSVLAHNHDDGLPILLRVVFPGYVEPSLPCLVSAGRIAKTGAVVADMIGRDRQKHSMVPLYKSEIDLRDDFRRLADELKLDDDARIEMFKAVQRWVVADTRLDPNFDPKDPDAKRLVVH